MTVFMLTLICLNVSLLTLLLTAAHNLRKEFLKVLKEAEECRSQAAEIVNTAHEAVTTTAQQVITLSKKLEDIKNTVELQKLQARK